MSEQDQGETPKTTAAPSYTEAAAKNKHFDPASTGGTQFAPDIVLGPGEVIQSNNIPGGDYYALRKIREQGRAEQQARNAEAIRGGAEPDNRLLQQGGLATVFETDEKGQPQNVQIVGTFDGAAQTAAGATPAPGEAPPAGASGPSVGGVGASGQVQTDTTGASATDAAGASRTATKRGGAR